ncbi:hypothetical protein NE848_10510 [Gramella jeungdoensis]|uniref:SMP-30/Gluconolactonase/LRE-like region domain-containing protein n=1 Tax=Gramella jeungdoensis TaxID=708091 RepID=A0ABT0Z257_9FLAO|nr:hypothetical protein [Gramella jeungdoensis]MCM8569813.1 hypothetical protein [Gramella jeungdoensis]
MRNLIFAGLILCMVLSNLSCSSESPADTVENFNLSIANSHNDWEITINETDLYPEGIEYDIRNNRFLISSITRGDIGQVINGEYSVFISDENLVSTLGIHIDHTTKRLLVTNTNIDGSFAELVVYNLTGENIFYADLGGLSEGGHLVNDVTTDNHGNAYVTDSYAGIIYKVDPAGNASIFFEDPDLAPIPGNFGLNGIDYDPRGFLLVSHIQNNTILKFPIDDPGDYSLVEIPIPLFSPDGIYLDNPNELIVVSNDFGGEKARVQIFGTRDSWETAYVKSEFPVPGDFLTTVTVKRNIAYVLSANLDILLSGGSTDEFKILRVD